MFCFLLAILIVWFCCRRRKAQRRESVARFTKSGFPDDLAFSNGAFEVCLLICHLLLVLIGSAIMMLFCGSTLSDCHATLREEAQQLPSLLNLCSSLGPGVHDLAVIRDLSLSLSMSMSMSMSMS